MPRAYSFRLAPFDRVCQAIESWRPRGCKTEKDYERSLVKQLEQELVNQTITPQYGSGRTVVDIMVQNKVPIELKKDLTSPAALQRTIGQLEGYLEMYDGIILVLCGDASSDLIKGLEQYKKKKDKVYIYKR